MTAKLRGGPIEPVFEARERSHGGDATLDICLGKAANLQAERQVLAHREVGEDGVVLEHEADLAPVGRHQAHVAAVEQDLPLRRRLDSGDHVHRRGLAAARWPQQREELLVPDLEIEGRNRGQVAEALGQARERD